MSEESRWAGLPRLGSPEHSSIAEPERRSSVSEAMEELRSAIKGNLELTDRIIEATAPYRIPIGDAAMKPDFADRGGAPLALMLRALAFDLRTGTQSLREVWEGLTA